MWTVIGWKVFPAHIWAACVIFAWATMSSLQAAVGNFAGLAAIRFFLGSFEAMYAGAPVYLSFFYPRDKLGFRQGIFISGAALANAYGGALGYAIMLIKSYLASWRILFLVEGLPAIIMAVVAYFVFPDSIHDATFLTDREKQVGAYCVNEGQVIDKKKHKGISLAELKKGFKDWRSYVTGVIFFGCNVSTNHRLSSFALHTLNKILWIHDLGLFCKPAAFCSQYHCRDRHLHESPSQRTVCTSVPVCASGHIGCQLYC